MFNRVLYPRKSPEGIHSWTCIFGDQDGYLMKGLGSFDIFSGL